MRTFAGQSTSHGFVRGQVFLYRGQGELPLVEYVVEPGKEEEELLRLRRAKEEAKKDVEGLIKVLEERGNEESKIFESHLMFLDDPMLEELTEKRIRVDRLNAEAAIKKVVSEQRAIFARMNDEYFKERVRDLDDVERRLLTSLSGFERTLKFELKVPSIIIADDLTPSETVQLDRSMVLGIATNGGSKTSHVALLARALAIPAVTGLKDITEHVRPGEEILLDGTNGLVTIRPTKEVLEKFDELLSRQKKLLEEDKDNKVAGSLKDGSEILLYANIHPGVPVEGLKEVGARGVGLYRSEYLWLNREGVPSEEDQFKAYSEAAKVASNLSEKGSITIRALDIGGDKLVRGISKTENNPFLGNRSIRYLLTHRDVMKTQLRAILRASAFGDVWMMYPMVSCVDELREASLVMEEVKRELTAEGKSFNKNIKVGAMIEVPSAAINAEAICRHVDFVSIGTNDLIQYTMAADRSNEEVAHLYQPTNPAVLKLIKMTISAAKKVGIPVGVCGESAADPIMGVLWVAFGVDMLSMSGTYIPLMSRMFKNLSRAELDDYASTISALPDDSSADEILAACRKWMEKAIPKLDDLLLL